MTTKQSELTGTQKQRLEMAATLTINAYDVLLTAQAREESKSDQLKAEADYRMDLSHFEQLRKVRGLMPGDRIRITADGPYTGQEGVIREWLYDGPELTVDWPEGSPCRGGSGNGVCVPLAHQVELVEAGS